MAEIKWSEDDVLEIADEALSKLGNSIRGNTQDPRAAMVLDKVRQAAMQIKGKGGMKQNAKQPI